MLDLLSKEDLASILLEASLRHSDVLDEVRRIADRDPSHRKIFVRGLGWETNSQSLKSTFSEFGELEEAIAIIDKNTGKSRGYGFVTFKHMDGALNALREPSKRIDGRISVCQLASMGSGSAQPPQDLAARKIYVGNVPLAWPVDHLLGIFSEFGEIEEGPLGLDKQAGKERGFALFIYKTIEATKRALEEPVKNIGGHQLFCKLAVEGAKQRQNPMHGQPDMSMPGLGMAQPGGSGPIPPNMPTYGGGGGSNQYGPTQPQPIMAPGGVSYGQNMSNPMNPALNQGMLPNIPIPNQSGVNNPLPGSAMNPSHLGGQPINTGVGQLGGPSINAMPPSYAPVDPYGPSHAGTYGGGYSGGGANPSSYSNPLPIVSQGLTSLQGPYGMPAYQAQQPPPSYPAQQQMAMPYQNQQQSTVPPRMQPTGVPSNPYYAM
jgi:heterogeneous nuclear ribonucleoprotein A1/A3